MDGYFYLNMFAPKTIKEYKEYRDIPGLDYQIKEIMDNFSFQSVEHFMRLNCQPVWNDDYTQIKGYDSWKMYSPISKKFQIPSEEDLKNTALMLLTQAKNYIEQNPSEVFFSSATGPFKVIYRYGIIELNAVVESWSCD